MPQNGDDVNRQIFFDVSLQNFENDRLLGWCDWWVYLEISHIILWSDLCFNYGGDGLELSGKAVGIHLFLNQYCSNLAGLNIVILSIIFLSIPLSIKAGIT